MRRTLRVFGIVLTLLGPSILILAHFVELPALVSMLLASAGIIPMAKYLGDATEELSIKYGASIGALMNATFGNATELIIAFIALRAGLPEVVQASITGSILGNLLLVGGLSILVGGLKHVSVGKQTFNVTLARQGSTMLLLSLGGLLALTLFDTTTSGVIIEEASLWISGCLILMYIAYMIFRLKTHKSILQHRLSIEEHTLPKWPVWKSWAVLAGATLVIFLLSELLVGSIEPVVEQIGWTPLFIGVIVVAIVGNAAEHATAVTMAYKDQMDLSLGIVYESSVQISTLVTPLLVFVSFNMATPMTLHFRAFEVVIMGASTWIFSNITGDGETHWNEGAALLILYLIFAGFFFLHP